MNMTFGVGGGVAPSDPFPALSSYLAPPSLPLHPSRVECPLILSAVLSLHVWFTLLPPLGLDTFTLHPSDLIPVVSFMGKPSLASLARLGLLTGNCSSIRFHLPKPYYLSCDLQPYGYLFDACLPHSLDCQVHKNRNHKNPCSGITLPVPSRVLATW